MISVILKIVAPPYKRDEIMRTFRSLVGATRVKQGNISCNLCQEVDNENAFYLIEEWKTEKDLNRNICSMHYKKLLALVDMSEKSPQIRFNTSFNQGGLKYIEKVLNDNH